MTGNRRGKGAAGGRGRRSGGDGSQIARGGGQRTLAVRVKSAKGRRLSSTRWLERQLNDPYVTEAKSRGLRSRAAFKLMQLDEKFGLLRPGMRVVDLGAAPGGWSQVAAERVKAGKGAGKVVAVDINPLEPMADVAVLQADMREDAALDAVSRALDGRADLVMSDMAAPSTGHAATDHLRVIALCEAAFECALVLLAPGGSFVAKVLQGGTEGALLARLRRNFAQVRHAKPPASRSDSSEKYVVATGFRGGDTKTDPD